MTDNVRGSLGPPWSVDLLADLHAGVLDPAESERLWPRVNADPEARAVLEALDSVKVELGQLGNAPVEPMPAQFAAQLDAALAEEAQARFPKTATATRPAPRPAPQPAAAPVVDLAAARKRRNRMAVWGAGVLTAAAAAVAFAFVALPGNTTGGSPSAQDGTTETQDTADAGTPPLALSSENLNEAIGPLTNKEDYGPLEDEQGLRDCLEQNDIPAGDTLGVSPVTLDGQDGVGALLGAGEDPGQFRLVVFSPTCEKLAESVLPN
jgi:hypothetical protein